MALLSYLKTLDPEARADLARRCNTSTGYLDHVARGRRRPSATLAMLLERETRGAIKAEEVLPSAPWEVVRCA